MDVEAPVFSFVLFCIRYFKHHFSFFFMQKSIKSRNSSKETIYYVDVETALSSTVSTLGGTVKDPTSPWVVPVLTIEPASASVLFPRFLTCKYAQNI